MLFYMCRYLSILFQVRKYVLYAYIINNISSMASTDRLETTVT